MEIKDVVFVSVAFGDKYVEQQDRLKQSILNIYPDANIMFWRDQLPDFAQPFLQSLYGFKVWAIGHAIAAGFQKVLWLDPAMILQKPIDVLDGFSVLAVKDENKLSAYISDEMLIRNDMTRDELDKFGLHLIGGSLYWFDFSYGYKAQRVFGHWKEDEKNGLFGTQEQEARGELNGHRADESCFAMALHKERIRPVSPMSIGYCTGEDPVFIKKHFK